MGPDMFVLTRIAPPVASDAPPVSYAAHIDPARKAGLTVEELRASWSPSHSQ